MFKIGEFSRLTRVSPRMLRHYEKQGLLRPAMIDRESGYRLYAADQIPLMGRIVLLRDMGFSIEQIGVLLERYQDAGFMAQALARKIQAIQGDIITQQRKLKLIEGFQRTISEEGLGMTYEVELKKLPEAKVLSFRQIIPAYDKEGELWHKLGSYMAHNGISCGTARGGYSIYLDDEHKDKDVDVEIAIPVDELGESDGEFVYKRLPEIPLAATIRFAGPYEGYNKAMERLGAWMEQNGYQFAGCVRGEAIVTPQDQSDPKNFLTEIQVPVRKA